MMDGAEKEKREVETDLENAELGSGPDRALGTAGIVSEGEMGAAVRG